MRLLLAHVCQCFGAWTNFTVRADPSCHLQALYVPACLPAEASTPDQPVSLTDTNQMAELLLLLQQQELAQEQPASPPEFGMQDLPAAADALTTAEQFLDAEISHLLVLKQLRLLLRTKQQLKQAMPALQTQDLLAQLTAMLQSKLQK
jgi:hypothetical protein